MTKRPPEPLDDGAELSALAPHASELAAGFVNVAADLALVIDADGVIRDIALAGPDSPLPATRQWIGRACVDTVSPDSRRKVELMLAEARDGGTSRRREVNLVASGSGTGGSVPVALAAVRLGEGGPILAVGRDLRATAALQQRFIESQQQMERDYWRRRQSEARYRLLFEVAIDAVMVLDALSGRVVEANRAAGALFGRDAAQLVHHELAALFAPSARPAVEHLVERARTAETTVDARLDNGAAVLHAAMVPLRADGVPLLLLRLRPAEAVVFARDQAGQLAELVERSPDAVVVADLNGGLRYANPAFHALCGLPPQTDLSGRRLTEWLGENARAIDDLLRQVSAAGLVARSVLPLRHGSAPAVEVSAALLSEPDAADGDGGDSRLVGLTLRSVAARSAGEDGVIDDLGHAMERLAERVGSVMLPSLMREGGDLLERHLLRAAMVRGGGTGPAAQLLGISEDSLALRLRRHRLPPYANATA